MQPLRSNIFFEFNLVNRASDTATWFIKKEESKWLLKFSWDN